MIYNNITYADVLIYKYVQLLKYKLTINKKTHKYKMTAHNIYNLNK